MTPAKIVFVGGGSYMWGPTFLRDIIVEPALCGSEIVLHDIRPEALNLVFTLGQKMIKDNQLPYTLTKTPHLDQALTNADVVILTITTGGLEAMRHDLEIPAKYGIHQSVGDTVGPGGLARGLRNIPVVVNLAQKMEKLCPQAWLLNYTNPMTTLCRAVTRTTKIKTVGLCHEFLGTLRALQGIFEADASEIQARVGGINHLIWILDLQVRGQDVFPELPRLAAQILANRGAVKGVDLSETTSLIDRKMVKARLYQIFGAWAAAGDRHLAEFFPYFLTEAAGRGQKYGVELTSIEERYQGRNHDKALIQALLNGQQDMQLFLQESSEEAVAKITAAITNGGSYTGIMNLPNHGQIANLPADAVVETYGVLEATGARGVAFGELPPGIFNVVNRHVVNQEMVVEAALTGDKKLALQILLNDPMVQELEPAEKMLDEMLLANKQYLPQFFA